MKATFQSPNIPQPIRLQYQAGKCAANFIKGGSIAYES